MKQDEFEKAWQDMGAKGKDRVTVHTDTQNIPFVGAYGMSMDGEHVFLYPAVGHGSPIEIATVKLDDIIGLEQGD